MPRTSLVFLLNLLFPSILTQAALQVNKMGSQYLDCRTLSGGIVNLNVGASETPFDMHIELLCDRSPYFDNMLADRCTDLWQRELVFPNDVPHVFADFVSWAYCGSISSAGTATDPSRILHLFQLWTLAEKFQVPGLRDLAFANCKELLDAKPDSLVGSNAVKHAYLHSEPGSAIRQLAVDIWAARAWKSDIIQARISLPSQFIEDLRAIRPGTPEPSASASEVYILHPVFTHDKRLCICH
ncbi:hypothetical protein BJX99DRAFT_229195 [Aspergillus californicus]